MDFITFLESVDNSDSKAHKSLKKKSESSGISLTILKRVYKKGMAAWNSGHRPGVSQSQWAMGRVNSFITGKGGARKADADLWKKAKASKKRKNESIENSEIFPTKPGFYENRMSLKESYENNWTIEQTIPYDIFTHILRTENITTMSEALSKRETIINTYKRFLESSEAEEAFKKWSSK